MAEFKVLIADTVADQAIAILKAKGIETIVKTKQSESELVELAKEVDGIILRSGAKITEKVINAGKRLKVVGRAGIGVDNIDVKAATKHGVIVMNTPLGNAITTAEHSLALLMSMCRHIPLASASTKAGKWEKSKFVGVELYGKTLVLIGCGTIGSIVADRAQALKMRVVAYDPFLSKEKAEELGVVKMNLDEALGCADFISIHVPLTKQTHHMLNAETLSKVKQGVRIVQCSRGGVVQEQALYDALKSGKVAAAALDVYEVEPAKDNQLFLLPNVICTPHLGASTQEAQDKVASEIAEQISDYLLKGSVTNALNMISLSYGELQKIKPYLQLVERLGYFIGQIVRTGIKEISIVYHGNAANIQTDAVTQAGITAVLSQQLASVNMVNAKESAIARGITIRDERHSGTKPYLEMIKISVKTERTTRSVCGTLFSDKSPRLLSIDNIDIEASFSEYMLFIRHKDLPGLIGNLGKVLAENKVNIATFNLGRHSAGGQAIALLGVDQQICDDLVPKIEKIPEIEIIQCLSFNPT